MAIVTYDEPAVMIYKAILKTQRLLLLQNIGAIITSCSIFWRWWALPPNDRHMVWWYTFRGNF